MRSASRRGCPRRSARGRKGRKPGSPPPYYTLYSVPVACCAEWWPWRRAGGAPWEAMPTRVLTARPSRSGHRAGLGPGGKELLCLPRLRRTVTSFLSFAYARCPLVLLVCCPASVVAVILCVPRCLASCVPPAVLVLPLVRYGPSSGPLSRKIHLKALLNI